MPARAHYNPRAMRILFITSTRIGDAVLSSGLLAHLIERNPEARITLACGAAPSPLFEAAPGLDRLVVLVKTPLGGHWRKLWLACAARRWDMVVDLRRTGIAWMLMAGERLRLGPAERGLHKVQQYARVFGLEETPPAPRLWTAASHETAAAHLIPEGPPVLAVGPTANWRGKEWRPERFAELAARLTGAGGPLAGARVAVFAGPGERDRARPVLEAVPEARRIDLTGAVVLPTAHAFLARCACFVGNDSGLMHLAAAAGAPTLGLFGPSRDEHYAPWGEAAAVVRTTQSYDELVGAPGYDHRETDTLMDGLSVEAAAEAAAALLARVGARAA